MSLTEFRKSVLLSLLPRDGVGLDQYDDERIDAIAAKVIRFADALYIEEEFMATSKQYAISETTITFGSEVGDTVAWSTEAIANAAGRQSAFHDRGDLTTARPERYRYRFVMAGWQATPTVGNVLELRIKTSDGTTPDNDDGTGDAAVSAEDKLKNLGFVGEIVCDEAAANIPAATEGIIYLTERYVGFVLWNRGGSALRNLESGCKLYLTPDPLQQQAS